MELIKKKDKIFLVGIGGIGMSGIIGMAGTIGMALALDGFALQPERNVRHAITIGSSVR